jgi:hypothetical protein
MRQASRCRKVIRIIRKSLQVNGTSQRNSLKTQHQDGLRQVDLSGSPAILSVSR